MLSSVQTVVKKSSMKNPSPNAPNVVLKIYWNQLTVINAVKKSNRQLYRAEFSCPRCGAPALLDETEFVINCAYCRTNVLLIPDRYFQYYFPASGSEDYIYIPYWRLRGSYFRIHNPKGKVEILTKFIDSTVLAVNMPHLPYSIGIRTQNLTLKPVHNKMDGRFLQPEIPLEQVRGKITRMQVSTQKMNRSLGELNQRTREHIP